MYNNDSSVEVESDLVNSYAWDTAIVFMQEMENKDYSINYPNTTPSIKNTGTTTDKVCNIYDMASNCYEWSTESSSHKGTDNQAFPAVRRGRLSYGNLLSWKISVFIKCYL